MTELISLPKLLLKFLIVLILITHPLGMLMTCAADIVDQEMSFPDKVVFTADESISVQETGNGNAQEYQNLTVQELALNFGNNFLTYYLQNKKNNGPLWLKTTEIQLQLMEDFEPVYSLETIQPLGIIEKNNSVWFWQGRYSNRNADDTANLGVGWRILSDDSSRIFGFNAFYDYGFQYNLTRLGLGVEYFHKQAEYRLNYYYPLSGDVLTGTNVQDNGILYSYIRAVEGMNLEMGTSLKDVPWWKVYAAGYYWNNQYHDDETSFRLRSAMQLTPHIGLEFGYQQSNLTSGETYGKITYNMSDILGPCLWSTPVIDENGRIIAFSLQIYQNGKPVGDPIIINTTNIHDQFTLKATPVTNSAQTVIPNSKQDNDISYKLLQKVDRDNKIKTETYSKLVSYNGSVQVIVSDGTNPISGATVSVTIHSATLSSTTDATGVASFNNLPVGTYAFTASAMGYSSTAADIAVTNSGGGGVIVLTRQTGGIQIIVTDGTNPISGAKVSLTVNGTDRATLTDGSGTASFAGIPTGTYTVTASKNGYTSNAASLFLTDSGSATATILIAAQYGNADVSVTDGANGLSGATVSVTVDSMILNQSTDASGAAHFINLPVGQYTFIATKTNYTTQSAANVNVSDRVTAIAAISLSSIAGTVTITVQTIDGNPIENSIITSIINGTTYNGVTDSNGQAVIPNVPNGAQTFTARAAGYGSNTVAVNVNGGGSGVVNLPIATYTITATTNNVTLGTVSPSSATVAFGSSQTVAFTPNNDCVLSFVIVDGVTLSEKPTSYTLTQIASDHNISAQFNHNPYVVSISNQFSDNAQVYLNNSFIIELSPNGTYSINTLVPGDRLRIYRMFSIPQLFYDHTITTGDPHNISITIQ